MRSAFALRLAAWGLGVAALFDPAWTIERPAPLPVDVIAAGNEQEADSLRRRLAAMPGMTVDAPDTASAVVVVGDTVEPESLPAGVPISFVSSATAPNVAMTAVSVPPVLLPGRRAAIVATVRGIGMTGATSTVALEYAGISLSTVEHRWSRDNETFEARFEHVPEAPGARVFRLTARTSEHETEGADNHSHVLLEVVDRRLQVFVHDSRPSWASTFVRRALEEDPLFEVSAVARPSRGIVARVRNAPARLTASALERFDAIVLGAPEDLDDGELDALEEFARRRGGAVAFLPDRKPAGRYARRIPVSGFTQLLRDAPSPLVGAAAPLRASEFALPVGTGPGVGSLADLSTPEHTPAIVAWAVGAGTMIYSGALDAWRFRIDGGFAAFWRARIAHAAAAAPRRLECGAQPGVSSPGSQVRLTARLRPTEFGGGALVRLPEVAARVIGAAGGATHVRLWPATVPGTFEGRFATPAAGRYLVEVSSNGLRATCAVAAVDGARPAAYGAPHALGALSAATGGVAVEVSHLNGLERHLAGLSPPLERVPVHPARSPWWAVAFIGALAGEWWLRRQRGAR